MHLRVTHEADTYVYATSAFLIGGLEPEDFVILLLPLALLHTFGVQPIVSLFVGCFCLYVYKKMTAGLPPGFLPMLAGLLTVQLLNSKAAEAFPPLKALALVMTKASNRTWIEAGLLPFSGYCRRYER